MNKKTLKYFNNESLPSEVWLNKYALKDKDGNLIEETPDDMHIRLAKEFARIEMSYLKDGVDEEKLSNLTEYGKKRTMFHGSEEIIRESFYHLFKDFRYVIPGGSVMASLGTGYLSSLSNCFVLDSPKDSIESIINTGRDMAQIMKNRGGVGIDISGLRPNGSYVNNSAKNSSGSVSFMNLYSSVTETIAQNGRRGALMISIDVTHPDVEEFINIKNDLTKVTGANISVKLSKEFINAVDNNTDFILKYPCDIELDENLNLSEMAYNKIIKLDEEKTIYIKKVKAKDIWDKLIYSSWKSAEPGIFNWDEMLSYDPTSVYPELRAISTNPCGELSLSGGDSCRLMCTNLYSLVINPFTDEAVLDEELAYNIFYETQMLADNLVDLELEAVDRILNKINPTYTSFEWFEKSLPITERQSWLDSTSEEFKLWFKIREIGSKGRRTGSGITAYGDMLAALNLPYGDKEMTDKLFKIKLSAELDATTDAAILRGTFPLYDRDKEFSIDYSQMLEGKNSWYSFLVKDFYEKAQRMYKYGRRNGGISTIAPTGTISIETQTTSGVEPLFMPFYKRRKKCVGNEIPDMIDLNGVGFKEFIVVHGKLKEYINIKFALPYDEINDLSENDLNKYYIDSPYHKQCAGDIDVNVRIDTQSLIQQYITASISSTINLPKETTVEEVDKIYKTAFKKKLKGVTVYRDGSRSGILVSTKDSNTKQISVENNAPKRPKTLSAKIIRFNNNSEKWVAAIGLYKDRPYELFTGLLSKIDIPNYVEDGVIVRNKIASTNTENTENQQNSRYDFIYKNQEGVECVVEGLSNAFSPEYWNYAKLISGLLRHGMPLEYLVKYISTLNLNGSSINTWKNAVIRIFKRYIKDGDTSETCPDCGAKLIRENGCIRCSQCIYSKCG
ncbi:MAG: adenosylcobalamin-dependent ribonucleoside-diphosphate reductase [Novosphingobium sp.]|nr:adenosylcobalamin-dependent ribonucleoside-diphosphate reductase [Novosphingobium sp.]